MGSRSRRPPASEIRKSRRPSPRWRGRTSSDPAPGTSCAGAAVIVRRPDADPVYLYTDDVIGILPERNLNNGQPSLHAALIAAAAPQPAEHVVHVGAGVGYYTAILAELVGATGRVTAIEFDGELVARATANFAQTPHVRVVHGDGTRIVFEPVDVVYVNAERVSTGEEVGFSLGGTDGSNPSPSSSESGANLTFLPQAAEHSPSLRANSTPSPEAKPS